MTFGEKMVGSKPMSISPQDIQNKEFREAFRGYNQEEVDRFLDDVAEDFGRLHHENQRMRIQLTSAQQDGAQRAPGPLPTITPQAPQAPATETAIRADERAEAREEMKRALVATQRAAEAALDEAKRRAAEIVARAERRAKEIDDMTARRAKDVDGDASSALTYAQQRVEELKRQESELRARLRRMLSEHVKMLQQLEGDSVEAKLAPASSEVEEATPRPAHDSPWLTRRERAASEHTEDASKNEVRATGSDGHSPAVTPVAPATPATPAMGSGAQNGSQNGSPVMPRRIGLSPPPLGGERSRRSVVPAQSAESIARSITPEEAPLRPQETEIARQIKTSREAVVHRMTRELGDAVNPPPPHNGNGSNGGDKARDVRSASPYKPARDPFWRR
ncbi:MAG: hypothetical protein NVSMB57_06480 [Actinomycetota bacterium]